MECCRAPGSRSVSMVPLPGVGTSIATPRVCDTPEPDGTEDVHQMFTETCRSRDDGYSATTPARKARQAQSCGECAPHLHITPGFDRTSTSIRRGAWPDTAVSAPRERHDVWTNEESRKGRLEGAPSPAAAAPVSESFGEAFCWRHPADRPPGPDAIPPGSTPPRWPSARDAPD